MHRGLAAGCVAAALAIFGLLGVAQGVRDANVPDSEIPRYKVALAVDAAEERFEARGPKSYVVAVLHWCFCGGAPYGPKYNYIVEVRNGEVIKVLSVGYDDERFRWAVFRTSNDLPDRWIRDWMPMARAFDTIRSQLSSRGIAKLQFDPKTGALQRYFSYLAWSESGYAIYVRTCGTSVRQCVDRLNDA